MRTTCSSLAGVDAAVTSAKDYFRSKTTSSSYPPVSSIPRTSADRLAAADPDAPASRTPAPNTVLYLAYGSNLSAEKFLGDRGIRPLSQVAVSAPTLRLTFDLPGFPYAEPCASNTAPRKVPKLPDPGNPPKFPDPPKVPPLPPYRATQHGDPVWDKGLIGVVYEVSRADYAHIIATEGGGISYQDIMVPCLALPPRMSVPEKPPIEIPRPFLAHTLFSPSLPDLPGDDKPPSGPDTVAARDGDGDQPSPPDKPEDPRKKWWWRFVTPHHRPDPEYAQPSARYLKLLTDGAAEHDLPEDYQRYLQGIHTYTITTRRQQIGKVLVFAFWLPALLLVLRLSKFLVDKDGKFPHWYGVLVIVLMNVMWMTYDNIFKPLFGDGERTEDKDDEDDGVARDMAHGRARRRPWGRTETGLDEEKRGLLDVHDL